MLKLYLTPRSPFARRVRLALNRLEIPHDEVLVDVFNPTAEYLLKQPAATVPVLEKEGGEIIPDSSLILDFLHDNYGKKLWGDFEEKVAATWCVAIMTNAVAYFLETQKKHPDLETLLEAETNVKRLLQKCSQIDNLVWVKNKELTQAGWDYVVAAQYATFRLSGLEGVNVDFIEFAVKNKKFKETYPKV